MNLSNVFLRYLILIAVALPNFWIFYFIFTPLTVYPVYFLLSFFYDSLLIENIILVNDVAIDLIKACIAGSAYYLLLILNLSIPKIKIQKRIKMILFAFGIFLAVNVLRIFLLGIMSLEKSSLFNFTHQLFWYLVSIVFVVGIWFTEVKIFKIKEIPFYSDIVFVYKKIFKK